MSSASTAARLLLAGSLLTAACTPLGAWLYDDPSFALARVGVRHSAGGPGPDSLELVLAGCNPNDYDLMGFGFDARLRVDGREIGAVRSENTYQLVMRDSTLITVMLPVQSADDLAPGEAMTSLYELVGQTRIHTPIGDRRVAMVQKGEVRREEGGLAWHAWRARACRPGLATLPGAWDAKSTLPTPEMPKARPEVDPEYTPPAGRPDGAR
jgi:hypothetical protein